MVDPSCSGRDRRFLLRLVDLVHDGVKAAVAFDGVPIGFSDGMPKNRRFWRGRCRVSGCPGLDPAGCGRDVAGPTHPFDPLIRRGQDRCYGLVAARRS